MESTSRPSTFLLIASERVRPFAYGPEREATMCKSVLSSQRFLLAIAAIDAEFAERVQASGCPICGARLDRADYPRRPRGFPAGVDLSLLCSRTSFCCANRDCRKRVTPQSLRFFDRRVYPSLFVTLAAIPVKGATPRRVREVARSIDVDRRTLERWRTWWTESVPKSRVWLALRGYFAEPIEPACLPQSLLERFTSAHIEGRLQRLFEVLRDLSHSALMQARFAGVG